MNDDVKEAEASTYEARAERARQRLSENLRDMTSIGEKMIRRTGRAGAGALIGLGALGLIVFIASRFRRRRAPQNPFARYLPKEPSFFKQALRSVVLSALGVLATRIAQRLPLPAPRAGNAPAE